MTSKRKKDQRDGADPLESPIPCTDDMSVDQRSQDIPAEDLQNGFGVFGAAEIECVREIVHHAMVCPDDERVTVEIDHDNTPPDGCVGVALFIRVEEICIYAQIVGWTPQFRITVADMRASAEAILDGTQEIDGSIDAMTTRDGARTLLTSPNRREIAKQMAAESAAIWRRCRDWADACKDPVNWRGAIPRNVSMTGVAWKEEAE